MRAHILLFFSSLLVGMCLLTSCPQDDPEPEVEVPVIIINTNSLPEITPASFSLKLSLVDDGGGDILERGICYKSSPGATINDEKIIDITTEKTFTCTATGLVSLRKYYACGYATNSAGTGYTSEKEITTSFEEVLDYEGNVYQAIKIGEQVWMMENLKSKKYPDGTNIQQGVSPAYGSEAYVEVYGRYYTWDAMMHGEASSDKNPGSAQGVCPDGYHIPSDAEWMELELFLGMNTEEVVNPVRTPEEEYVHAYRGGSDPMIAGAIKAGILWSPNPGLGNNSSGFSAIPAGYLHPDGSLPVFVISETFFWTSTADTVYQERAWDRGLVGDSNGIWRCNDVKTTPLSVRCVKDE